MSKLKRYLIRLTPLDTFFFGGEKTFGMGQNDNYLIRSNRLPQQTTLLGTVRKTLLEQCGLLGPPSWNITDKSAAINLIGNQSFHLNGSKSAITFGAIRQMSPVFLMKGQQRYFPCPFDYGYTLGMEQGEALFTHAGGKTHDIPVLHGYKPKEGITRHWISDNGKPVAESDIFSTSERPGVWKGAEGEEDEQGYYKEFFQKFNGDWSFCLYLELDEQVIAKCSKKYDSLQPAFVTMGKERSSFRMEAESVESATLEQAYHPKTMEFSQAANSWEKITLLSDTYTYNEIYDYCIFAVTETSNFRFIGTQVNQTKKYANITRNREKISQPWKSSKYNLLKRGSTLYVTPENLETLTTTLENARFKQIGYNWYSSSMATLNQ